MRARGLFVTDLDGTLVSFETGGLPKAHREALLLAEREGVVVAIVTGRRLSGYRREEAKLAGLRHRVSVSNGAVLLSEDLHAPARVHELPWDAAFALARTGGEGVHGMLAITTPADPEAHDCWMFRPDGRVFAARSPWKPETHVAATSNDARAAPLVHVALHVATRELAEELEPRARAAFAGRAHEVHSVRSPGGGGALLEVVVEGGKGRAVRDLAAELGLPRERTAAIGDDMNDARMLEAAGHGYAVGGSVLAARHPRAIEVVTCEEGAVADALSRFLREL